jgi:hypothetical protein
MQRRARLQTVVLSITLVSGPVLADEPPSILGKSFVVRDGSVGTDPTRRRVTMTAKEAASPTALVGDPTPVGAALVVDTISGVTQTFDLPAGAWRDVKGGFRYDDGVGAFGAVVRLVVRRDLRGTFTIKAKLSGAHAQLDVVPPDPGAEAAVAVVFHDGPIYCTHFGGVAGGAIRNDGARLFKVSRPTALGPCPSIVLPTTPPTTSIPTTSSSSTTSTSRSTTTSTSIVGPPCGEINGGSFCWGECPAETPICAYVGGSCQCVSGTQPCGGRGTECDGACPVGQACVSGGFDCACMPVESTPCYTGTPGGGPVCGGFCPQDETCEFVELPNGISGCVCAPPTCFGPRTCGAACPPGRSCNPTELGGGLISCLCLP